MWPHRYGCPFIHSLQLWCRPDIWYSSAQASVRYELEFLRSQICATHTHTHTHTHTFVLVWLFRVTFREFHRQNYSPTHMGLMLMLITGRFSKPSGRKCNCIFIFNSLTIDFVINNCKEKENTTTTTYVELNLTFWCETQTFCTLFVN